MCDRPFPITVHIEAGEHGPGITIQADPMTSPDLLDMHITRAVRGWRECQDRDRERCTADGVAEGGQG